MRRHRVRQRDAGSETHAHGPSEVQKIDVKTNQVVGTFEVDGQPCGIVFVDGFLWVGSVGGSLIDQVDPKNGIRG